MDNSIDTSLVLAAERDVLGGLMLDSTAYERIPTLSPEHFVHPDHQVIFKACQKLIQAGHKADPIVIFEQVQSTPMVGGENWFKYLNSLVVDSFSTANIEQKAGIIFKHHQRQAIRQVIFDIANHLDNQDPMDALSELHKRLDKIGESGGGGIKTISIGEALRQMVDTIERKSRNEYQGTITGLRDLDAVLNIDPTDLVILAGRPSSGKTALAMNIASNVAEDKTVLVFSMEMDAEALARRITASLGHCDMSFLTRPQKESDQELHGGDPNWVRLSMGIERAQSRKLEICEASALKPEALCATAKRVHRKTPLGLILVDYLGLMSGGDDTNRNLQLGSFTKALKGLAKDLRVPVLCLAQLSRNCENRSDKRPIMSDLRDSGEIENDADAILGLYREAYYNPDYINPNEAEVGILKQRNGECKTIGLHFEGRYSMFADLGYEFKKPEKVSVRGVRGLAA